MKYIFALFGDNDFWFEFGEELLDAEQINAYKDFLRWFIKFESMMKTSSFSKKFHIY